MIILLESIYLIINKSNINTRIVSSNKKNILYNFFYYFNLLIKLVY